jgi:hypothetical protein
LSLITAGQTGTGVLDTSHHARRQLAPERRVANVIVRSIAPVSTVPPLIGADQGTAASRLAGRGLTVGTVTTVVDPARAGTVIAENSPAGPSSRPDHRWT